MERQVLCPQLHVWRKIYAVLEEAYEQVGRAGTAPPLVFNMQGWQLSGDVQKKERWEALVSWAAGHGFAHLIGELSPDEWYDGED